MNPCRESYLIRPLDPQDYETLVALWTAAGSSIQVLGRESREAMTKHFHDFSGLSFGAVRDGRLIGVVLGTHDGRKGWINRLAVLPECRRQGVAEALVTRCDAAIRAAGIEIVAALVERDNQASASLFRKLDFSDAIEVHYFRKVSSDHA